jgi:hypothetical protein
VRGRCPNIVTVHPGEYLGVWRGVVRLVAQARDPFERKTGWAVGWLRSRARESLAQTSTTASEPLADLLVDAQAVGVGGVCAGRTRDFQPAELMTDLLFGH